MDTARTTQRSCSSFIVFSAVPDYALQGLLIRQKTRPLANVQQAPDHGVKMVVLSLGKPGCGESQSHGLAILIDRGVPETCRELKRDSKGRQCQPSIYGGEFRVNCREDTDDFTMEYNHPFLAILSTAPS
jgi:hypothetical protein